MDSATRQHLERRARVLKAMAHATRIFIVQELADGERCVADLQEKIGADMSTVSKHLSVLREAGIVESEKRANQVFYTLRCPCVMRFFGCIEDVLAGDRGEPIELAAR